MILDEFQRDAIAELLNIGMGRAAAALSEMVGESVDLSVPNVEFLSQESTVKRIHKEVGTTVTAIKESFEGTFWGDAMLLFPEHDSLSLVRALLKEEDLPLEELSDMEQEALTEVGNIILNACLGTLANVFKQKLDFRLPEYTQGDFERVLRNSGENSIGAAGGLLLVQMNFHLQQTKVNGFLILLMDVDSLQAFSEELEQYLNSLG